jgi:23S rRNA (uracil1939-C5)-methyltransferase
LDGAFEAQLGQEAQRLKVARLTWDGEVIATLVPPVQRFGAARVVPPPGAFLQATREGEAALVAVAQEIVGDAKSVVDLFAGCGTFSLPMAGTAEVHAIEGEAAMMRALDRGWREAQGLKRVSVETRDLFRNPLMAEDLRYEAAVIDPPRAGALAQTAELARSDIARIAFVSCNPVTFARDAKVLVDAGYRLDWVQVVDQFRWSSHVELVGAFAR